MIYKQKTFLYLANSAFAGDDPLLYRHSQPLKKGAENRWLSDKKVAFSANFSKKFSLRPPLFSLLNFLEIFANLGFRNLAHDQFSNHDKSRFLFKNSFNDARARYLFPWTLKI